MKRWPGQGIYGGDGQDGGQDMRARHEPHEGGVQKDGERQGRNGHRRAMEIEGECMRTDGG